MKVLVTGGAGFIGSHIVEHFQGKADVRVLDNFRSGYIRNLDGFDVELIEGSVTDKSKVKAAVSGVDYIFHLAAMVSVPESMSKPLECVDINVNGTLNLLQASADAGARKLILSSSAAVYGDNPIMPKIETMIPEPKSPYAITKLDGEYYCNLFNKENWLSTGCLRYFNVFGPRQDPNSAYAAAVPIFINKAMSNDDIHIYGDGRQTRDFIFVKDIVRANVWLAEHVDITGVYNAAYGKSQSINELAAKIIKLTCSDSEIVHMDNRPGDIKDSVASIERLTSTGLELKDCFDEGLSQTISYIKNA